METFLILAVFVVFSQYNAYLFVLTATTLFRFIQVQNFRTQNIRQSQIQIIDSHIDYTKGQPREIMERRISLQDGWFLYAGIWWAA
jgi:hypothetical protein